MSTLPDSSGSAREFPLGVVLSLTQPRLACAFPDLHEFVEYLLDEPVWTLGLLSAAEPCRAHLLTLFPALADVTMPEEVQGEAGVQSWLDALGAVHGCSLRVPKMPPGQFSAGGFGGELERIAETGKPAVVVAFDGVPGPDGADGTQ
jgi:hypothetical protein